MELCNPVTLSGNTLGQRHRHLNSLVSAMHYQGTPFAIIQRLPEHSALDRIYKIDLASKHRNVEYIIHNLKDDDMLFVSRALKNTWLLETQYSHIINADYLEEKLYPQMVTTAVNKMRHWIHNNLRDTKRCEEFYEFYSRVNYNLAIKFLWHCSKDFILNKLTDVLDKITPKYLKMLSEKCPEVVKIFFNSFQNNETVLCNYLDNEKQYYDNIKCILKLNSDIFLDITEKYYNKRQFGTLSPEATKYIMTSQKTRFRNKPELYTALLLDMTTLASFLNEDEIKDVVIRLAKAEYLKTWFSYKNVEPLFKKLNVDMRTEFKKKVFVDKSFGDLVKDWPYEPPAAPQKKSPERHIFQDRENIPYMIAESDCSFATLGICLKSARYNMMDCTKSKTYLDQLFDKFRFDSFEKTLFDLRTKMKVESLKNRQDMMLVLVSKTGGRPESVDELLKLLISCHENEPANLRATVIRSLVNRSAVWRVPEQTWQLLLHFGRDLGLDGALPIAPCTEGLHAVVLRKLMLNHEYEATIKNAFLKEFSSLNEYPLNAVERRIVSTKLPAMLLSDANANPKDAVERFEQLLDALDDYKIRADHCPGVVQAIANTTRGDSDASTLLYRLFYKRVARKELFKDNFAIIKTDASYFNALKHDMDVLKADDKFEAMVNECSLRKGKFFRSLALYFNEQDELSEKYLKLLQKNIETSREHQIAGPIVLLARTKLISILQALDEYPKNSPSKRLAIALRANAHLARPRIDLEAVKWQWIGAKAVANRVLTSSTVNAEVFIPKLLSTSRMEKLALVLSMRIGKEISTFETMASKRPKLVLKTSLRHCKNENPGVWDVIIAVINKLGASENVILNKRLIRKLNDDKIVPSNRKPEYYVNVYNVLNKISRDEAMCTISNCELILTKVDCQFIEMILQVFLDKDFTEFTSQTTNHHFGYNIDNKACLLVRILAKFLLLCENESTQKRRILNQAAVFFDRYHDIWQKSENSTRQVLLRYLDEFIHTLKYNEMFLNTKYISCLPVFEYVINRLHKILPIELYSETYVRLHLNMLYYKSIRQGIKNKPDIFENLSTNLKQAVEIVGLIFGNYIAHEAQVLTSQYFDSIINIFKKDMLKYLRDDFIHSHIKENLFTASVMKGILECDNNEMHVLAVHIFKEYCRGSMERELADDVLEALKNSKSKEVPFFLHATHYY